MGEMPHRHAARVERDLEKERPATRLRFGASDMRRVVIRVAVLLLAVLAGVAVSAIEGRAAELLMFHQRACAFCDRFKAEIAPDYPRSRAGAVAPLRLVDIWESRTGGIEGLEPAIFTPTFVLVDKGKEVGRLLGYPGRRYFYPEIEALIARMGHADSAVTD